MSPASSSTRAGAGGLAALALLHAAWAAGSSWPLPSRAELADAVIGREGGEVPSPAACMLVAALLAAAAALVGAGPSPRSRLRLLAARAVVGTLSLRAAAGLAGHTELLSPGSCSPRFRELDRRLYAPLCAALAVLSLPAASRRPAPFCGARCMR